ncbi:hypothetical protein AURDEDRAFT_174067 [Auricularia subglabra TFB-10046 SS5]|nr:hypothetical protein AURDEDRAFT_174067 [Auricularia subglabra TFB-10046 SS5]
MFVPRALVLAVAAFAGAVVAAPSFAGFTQELQARTTCTAPGWGSYTCQGACCICDAAGNPGCVGPGHKCECAA